MGVEEINMNLRQVSEEIFDTSDNLFVFFLDKAEDLLDRKEDIQRAISVFKRESSLRLVRFYYNVRKDGDPPIPEGSGSAENEEGLPPLRCLVYKGQRKKVIHVGAEVPLEEVTKFFTPLVENLKESSEKLAVPLVNGQTFKDEVISASTVRPVLLQMYEDTCFLCFLMRPFVNSLAALFASNGVPLDIKRLNIERNDFPEGCPVARGTPTFVFFRGGGSLINKWDEFKPKDLVERISTEYPYLKEEMYGEMDELQGLVSRRFQLFTQLVMWNMELQKLEGLVTAASMSGSKSAEISSSDDSKQSEQAASAESGPAEQPVSAAPASKSADDDDGAFSSMVSEMMAKDMRRTDFIAENLIYLQKEVDEVEHDAALLGVQLAQLVQEKELE